MTNNKPNDVRETIAFEFKHPVNGETHTVSVSMEEIAHHMCEVLFEKLCGEFCQCEPVGETNVVDCRCDEYADEFERVKSYAQSADQQGEPDVVIDLAQPNPHSDGLHIRIWHNTGMLGPGEYKLYSHAQPATAKVVLPERRDEDPSQSDADYNSDCGWNACLDKVAKLNGVQS